MCLDIIKDIKITEPYGYKVFRKTNNKIRFLYQNDNNITNKIPFNKWIDEKHFRQDDVEQNRGLLEVFYISQSNERFYRKGFHLYKNKSDAIDIKNIQFFQYPNFNDNTCVVYKVKFKEVVATGFQGGRETIVARKIKILKE